MGLIFIDRIKTFFADPQKKKLVLLIFVLAIIPLTVIAALTVQNLQQRAGLESAVRISDQSSNTLSSTSDPNVFIDINLNATTNWALPSKPSASNNLIKNAYAVGLGKFCTISSQCDQGLKCGNFDEEGFGQCISSASTPTPTPTSTPTPTTAITPTPTVVQATITPADCSSFTDATSCFSQNKLSENILSCGWCVLGNNLGLCVPYGSACPALPNNSPSVTPSSAPTPNILRSIYIENKDTDGSAGGSAPVKVTVNSGADIAHISWRLNDLLSDQNQASRIVQVTLFSDNEISLILTSTVVLTRLPGLTPTSTPILSIISPTLSPTPTIPLIPSCGGQCGYTACKSYEKCNGAESEFGSPTCKISIACGATCNDVVSRYSDIAKIKGKPCEEYSNCFDMVGFDIVQCNNGNLCSGQCDGPSNDLNVKQTVFSSNIFPREGPQGTLFTITVKSDPGWHIQVRMSFPSSAEGVLEDDGLHGDGLANDGIYGWIFNSAGEKRGQYLVSFSINGVEYNRDDILEVLIPETTGDKCISITKNGDPKKKIDIVIMPNQYNEKELEEFQQEILPRHINFLFSKDPFSLNKDKFNVWFAKQSLSEKLCTQNNFFACARLAEQNAYETCALFDKVIVLSKDDKIGGSGFPGSEISITNGASNARSEEVTVHEFGHSFGQLADEYDIPWFSSYTSLANCDVFACPKWCNGRSHLEQPRCGQLKDEKTCKEKRYNGISCSWIPSLMKPFETEQCIYPYDEDGKNNFGQSCQINTACFYGCGGKGYRSSADSIMNSVGANEFNAVSKKQIQKMIDSYLK